jgi:uncharacterized protein (DUF305 family)
MIVSLGVGLVVGYYVSPTYQRTMYTSEMMGLGSADRFLDLRYINQMASHHKGAILLARQIAGKSTRPEINALAEEILQNEPKLISELYAWKKEWYKDSSEAENPEVTNLGKPDEKIDLRFLNALISHHEAGILMAQEAKVKSSRNQVLDNADAVENFLKNSLVTLMSWRELWYGVK